jgi:hypothetical protein
MGPRLQALDLLRRSTHSEGHEEALLIRCDGCMSRWMDEAIWNGWMNVRWLVLRALVVEVALAAIS